MNEKIPSYRKKKVKSSSGEIHYYAVVTLGRRDVTLGKWNSKSSKQKYSQVICEWNAGGTGSENENAEISVTEVCVDYTREMKKRYQGENGKPNDEYQNITRIMKLVRANYGSTDAAEFKALRFKAMRQKFVDKGLCRYVVNKYSRQIIRAFKLAAENEKLSAENKLCAILDVQFWTGMFSSVL